MGLLFTKNYPLTSTENYEVTYWRVSKIKELDMDQLSARIILKGYKSKAHRDANGVNSQYSTVEVKGHWVFTNENMEANNMLELAYMSVKQSTLDEGLNIDWSSATDEPEGGE